jgi:BASS family bile acid:Na+ symporter
MAPLRQMRLVVVALILNFIVAPVFAWLLTTIIPLQSGHAIALFLLSGAAGAPFLPKLVATARGDVASAVALMALLTFGTILFMPLALPVIIPGMQANAWSIAQPLLLLIVLPLIVGMLIKHRAAGLAARLAPGLTKLANASLLLLFLLLLGFNFSALLGVVGSGAILAAILYVIGLFAVAWILGMAVPKEKAVLALTTSARNFGAALVPAAASFDDPAVTTALIVNAIVGLVLTFLAAAWLVRRRSNAAVNI